MEISEYIEAKTVVSVSCCAFPLYEQRDDELIIDVVAEITIIRPSTIDLERTVSFNESFSRSSQALLASDHDGALLLSSILTKDLELPFDWTKQTLVWGSAKEETSMEGITARLLRAAQGIAIVNNNNKNNGGREMMMVIFVTRYVNLTMDEKKILLDLNVIIEGGQNPLSDWIAKNLKDLLLNLQDDDSSSYSSCARQTLSKLYRVDKMFLGLKSVEVLVEEGEEEEEAAAPCCAICLKGFRPGEIGIGTPCSHVFHGFCILAWIKQRETCPLCRFDLLN